MKGKNVRKLAAMLCAAILLSAIGPGAFSVNAEAASAKTAKTGGSTLAQRLEGKYSCYTRDSEGLLYYTLEIANFHGNLYARDSYSYKYDEDDDSYSLQSFKALELIPEDPAALFDSRADSCEVKIQSFSILSNVARYQAPPEPYTITLTRKGIRLAGGEEDSILPDAGEEGAPELIREEDAEDPYESGAGYLAGGGTGGGGFNGRTQKIPEELYGIWRLKGAQAPLIIEFAPKNSSEDSGRGRVTLWHKEGGREVFFARGEFRNAAQGAASAGVSGIGRKRGAAGTLRISAGVLHNSEPFLSEDSYTLENRDTLVLEGEIPELIMNLTKTDTDPASGSAGAPLTEEGKAIFERISEKDIPLTVLKDPDDADTLLGRTQRVRLPGGENRRIIPQIDLAEDVENNGGMFVRLGNAVFYRRYDPSAADNYISGLWGEFLGNSMLSEVSELCFYDLESGRSGVICEDAGYGPLWYMNGWFYVDVFEEAEEGYYEQKVCRFLPDGSRRENLTRAAYAQIRAVSEDNGHLCISTYGENHTYVIDGTAWWHEVWQPSAVPDSAGHNYIFAGFAGENLILSEYDDSGDVYVLYEYLLQTDDLIKLGEVSRYAFADEGFMEVKQLFTEGEAVYIGAAWYSSEGEMLSDYLVLKAESGAEGSLEVVQKGMPEGFDLTEGVPYFFTDTDGTLLYTFTDLDGEVILSGSDEGDLIYCDSPFSAWDVVYNLIPESPITTDENKTVQFLQCAEAAGGAVWYLIADAVYSPEDCLGPRPGYRLTGFRCYKVDIKDAPLDADTDDMKRRLLWEK